MTFLLNLGIFSTLTYHNKLTGGNQEMLANTAVGLAFASFMIIIGLYHFFQQFSSVWPKLTLSITRNKRENEQLCEQLIATQNKLNLVSTVTNTTVILVSKM